METIVDFTKPRNVIDRYQWMRTEDILLDLADKRHNFSILLCNLKNDVNIGSAIRSHAGFLGQEIILYGHKTFNRVPSIGTYAYSIIKHLKFVEEIGPMLGEYDEVIGCDFIEGKSVSVWDSSFDYEKKTLLCFGHENDGLPPALIERCDRLIHIPMFGVTRSFNVAVSAAIVMNEYVRGIYSGQTTAANSVEKASSGR
ncbi:MAG: hypothetical protein H7Z41_12595 [Cytophagales bacterium]|nr:hypothetical protein [Armatimonadota bacterium]